MAGRHEAPQLQPDRELIAALEKWAAQPRAEANLRALALLVASMLAISLVAWELPDRATFLRNTALLFVGAHAVLHFVWVWLLARLRDRGIHPADAALRTYLEPRRVTHLDAAVSWLALAAIVPILGQPPSP